MQRTTLSHLTYLAVESRFFSVLFLGFPDVPKVFSLKSGEGLTVANLHALAVAGRNSDSVLSSSAFSVQVIDPNAGLHVYIGQFRHHVLVEHLCLPSLKEDHSLDFDNLDVAQQKPFSLPCCHSRAKCSLHCFSQAKCTMIVHLPLEQKAVCVPA